MKQFLLVLAILGIFVSKIYAVPDIVYRVDSRGPNEIFKNGFKAYGNNDDVLAHVSGKSTSIGSRDSAFIATTEDINEATRFLNFFLSQKQGQSQYLYRIYVDDSFYSTNITLANILNNANLYSTGIVTAAKTLYETFSIQQEWLGKNQILPANIIDAAEYIWNPDINQIKLLKHVTNTAEQQPTTKGNNTPYIFQPQSIDFYYYIKVPGCNVISDDFCPVDGTEMKKSTSNPTCNNYPIYTYDYTKPIACFNVGSNIFSMINGNLKGLIQIIPSPTSQFPLDSLSIPYYLQQ